MKCMTSEKMVIDILNNDKQKQEKRIMLEKYKRKLEIRKQQQKQTK